MRFALLLAAVLAVAAVGCGPKDTVEMKVAPSGPPPAKAMLEGVAASGELGSGAMEIRTALEQLKATDSAKGTALLSDMDALEKLTDPEQIKAKAKEMAGKL